MDYLPDVAEGVLGLSYFKKYFDKANEVVNYSFIDEIFHVNQAEEFWNGNFHVWDPKITTPPGLYYLAYGWLKATGLEFTLENLRLLNLVGGAVLLLTTYFVKRRSNRGVGILSLFSSPLLTIYYTLFYTDIWSLVLVLQSFVISSSFEPSLLTATSASLFGFASLFFRQTNIIWLAFALAVMIDKLAKNQYKDVLTQDIFVFVRKALTSWGIVSPFLMVFLAFANFVIQNGGITLGDSANHVVVPHLTQVFYCFTFLTCFSIPLWLSPKFIDGYVQSLVARKYLVLNAFWFFLIFFIVQNFSFVHPFILADNRHYTFYIVRKILFRTEYSRFFLIPVYHFASYTVYKLFTKNNSKVLYLAFLASVVLTIAPSPLFEPRYFIVPLAYWRLQVQPEQSYSALRLALESVWNYWFSKSLFDVYFNYVFQWEDLPDLQRIIW
ncbi:hypothetical protein OGAPHI_000119 [Ogataea philodendri]|uniref:Dol-P-Glc:Glc(2)Man(9)GlcNAc(2)-PP-Dol alpha-1,2-glucosyltransferase n=1 Tax=Ogataea philodendri TaxID=1378263 RepID=A0A9P8PGQ8_9ASCO|nr:uncharacterized protein OGAPHI_000119 [Ogataea philodendri]KAH3671933.1 hypothetical protein OGAPHI_000119 [Ogataea philodendri]